MLIRFEFDIKGWAVCFFDAAKRGGCGAPRALEI